jgi:C_GCAxxG_C_C family probable redox protein
VVNAAREARWVWTGRRMDEREAIERARASFLDDRTVHGCAETTFITLKAAFGLPDPDDAGAAMALNGGIAYSGGTCGAVSGAALAVGILAERRIADHQVAKRVARRIIVRLMDDFRLAHGAINCRDLIGLDLRAPGAHREFIDSGVWRERCMDQIEFAVRALLPLADEATWARAVDALGGPE